MVMAADDEDKRRQVEDAHPGWHVEHDGTGPWRASRVLEAGTAEELSARIRAECGSPYPWQR